MFSGNLDMSLTFGVIHVDPVDNHIKWLYNNNFGL